LFLVDNICQIELYLILSRQLNWSKLFGTIFFQPLTSVTPSSVTSEYVAIVLKCERFGYNCPVGGEAYIECRVYKALVHLTLNLYYLIVYAY